jgi:peptidoglycan/xylan/chitin deacetylase (PgdA/CDA1 family)
MLDLLESLVARLTLRHQSEAGVLLVLLSHSLFESKAEAMSGLINPLETLTVERLREIIDHLLTTGYTFPDPYRISELSIEGKYALLTVDDGYYNNVRWLDVMKEFQVPAIFFVCTSHIQSGNAFFWDVLWRERMSRRAALPKIHAEIEWLKSLPHQAREDYLVNEFGAQCLESVGDFDRPFRPAELHEFACAYGVYLGAHTRHHDNLCLLPRSAAETEIVGSVDDLEQITGRKSSMFSYPLGGSNQKVQSLVEAAGIRYAFTVHNCRNLLPVTLPALGLSRATIMPIEPVQTQCMRLRSRYRIRPYISSIKG